MKTNYYFLFILIVGLYACSDNKHITENLKLINSKNALITHCDITHIYEYKYHPADTVFITFVKGDSLSLFFNRRDSSFALGNYKELFFYDKSENLLYHTKDASSMALVSYNLSGYKYESILKPKSYQAQNETFGFTISDYKTNPRRIDFDMFSGNDNALDMMSKGFFGTLVQGKGTYFVDTNTYLIQKFIKQIDSAEVVGDGIYKQTFKVTHNINQEKILGYQDYVNRILASKEKYAFPEYFDLENIFVNIQDLQEKHILNKESYLKTLNQDSLKLSDISSDYILMDFWFMECLGCIKGIPQMNNIYNDFPKSKVSVIGVNPKNKNISALKDFVKKMEIEYPIYLINKSFVQKYNVQHYPTYILIDNRKETTAVVGSYKTTELKEVLKKLD